MFKYILLLSSDGQAWSWKIIPGMHNERDSYLSFSAILRCHMVWVAGWQNALCLRLLIGLNSSVKQNQQILSSSKIFPRCSGSLSTANNNMGLTRFRNIEILMHMIIIAILVLRFWWEFDSLPINLISIKQQSSSRWKIPLHWRKVMWLVQNM